MPFASRMSYIVAAQISPLRCTPRAGRNVPHFSVDVSYACVRMPVAVLPVTYSPTVASPHLRKEIVSLQPSPRAPVWAPPPRWPPPTRRLDTPCPYSCAMTSPSSEPSRHGRPGGCHVYICMRGLAPSPGVPKLALFVHRIAFGGVLLSRQPKSQPSCASASTGSLPAPPRPKLSTWKFRDASSNPRL